ncbi:sensor histidine kinase [Bacillus sp. 1P06AnD]|uniref:sensor histidine kinase n=1 Tax=Bacillus sp. 1P06AnD TaxID=3132208 RepID=UPI0039A21A39
MKRRKLSLQHKLWLTIFCIILLSVGFAYYLSQLFYEKLYVDYVKENLYSQAEQLAQDYQGGPLTDEYKEHVKWLNSKTQGEIFVVNNPRELSACVPFDLDYHTLISDKERQTLLDGNPIFKKGFEERFQRDIVAVIYPLLDNGDLKGIIYSYIPLTSIKELTKEFTFIWIIAGILYMTITLYLGVKIINKIVKPLKEIEQAANKVSQGDYSTVLNDSSDDEIASLAKAFNKMSHAIKVEDERKRDFLADISHELRTPLSYVKGYTQALLDGLVRDQKEQVKYLNLIDRETKQLQNLVQDLLDLTKMESNTFVIDPEPIAFSQFVEDTLDKYKTILLDKNLTLKMDLDPEAIILGDGSRLEQVIQNIVENSIRYSKDGGSIHVALSIKDNHCYLEISDNGIGISEEHLKRITERFYRVNKARSRFNGGTGLGLSIVEKLMQLHNGEMTIESKLNVGTRVNLIFPLLEDW